MWENPIIMQLSNDPTKSTRRRFVLYSTGGAKREYDIVFRYSTREDCWYVDFYLDGNLLNGSVRCVPGVHLLYQTSYRLDQPWGPIIVWNFSDMLAEPREGELGKSAFVMQVLYWPEA